MRRFAVFAFFLLVALPAAAQPAIRAEPGFVGIVQEARGLQPLKTLIVARDGRIVVEEGFHGHRTDEPTNIKSASKSVISALVGIAIDRGVLKGVDQPVAPILARDLPADPDPRLARVTIGNLLSMQAGLGRTSGPEYGRWVMSRDWVRHALARPFADDPGAGMLYSTGSTHLLSAILTRVTGRSTLELARDWLGSVDGFRIASWERDPQGIYLGGNNMAMTPRSLLAFGELYRNGGMADDMRVLSERWIEQSWTPRTRSVHSGEQYGYNWFVTEMSGHRVAYAWGFGGQMLYIAPDLGLTVVMTSGDEDPSARTGHLGRLHALMTRIVATVAALDG